MGRPGSSTPPSWPDPRPSARCATAATWASGSTYTDWEELAELEVESYRLRAPRILLRELDS